MRLVESAACTLAAEGAANRPVAVLVDRRALTRHSVQHLLEQRIGEMSVCAVARSEELLSPGLLHPGDSVRLVIFNMGSMEVRDDEFLRELALLSDHFPEVPVIVVADYRHSDDVAEALRHGVRGYIPTSLDPSIAMKALRLVQAGGTYIPECAFQQVLDMISPRTESESVSARTSSMDLTPRQNDFLRLLREGKSNKAIARDLDMHESTVKVHLRQIMRKLHASNRTHAGSDHRLGDRSAGALTRARASSRRRAADSQSTDIQSTGMLKRIGSEISIL